MPKLKFSPPKSFQLLTTVGPFDFNKEDYIIIPITDIRNEEDCCLPSVYNLKAVFRNSFYRDLAVLIQHP